MAALLHGRVKGPGEVRKMDAAVISAMRNGTDSGAKARRAASLRSAELPQFGKDRIETPGAALALACITRRDAAAKDMPRQ